MCFGKPRHVDTVTQVTSTEYSNTVPPSIPIILHILSYLITLINKSPIIKVWH